MNTHAQAGNYAVAFMLAVSVIIIGIALAPVLNQATTSAMSENATTLYGDNSDTGNGLNCNGGITDFTKAGCWVLDMGQVLFIGGLIALAGTIIAARIIFK